MKLVNLITWLTGRSLVLSWCWVLSKKFFKKLTARWILQRFLSINGLLVLFDWKPSVTLTSEASFVGHLRLRQQLNNPLFNFLMFKKKRVIESVRQVSTIALFLWKSIWKECSFFSSSARWVWRVLLVTMNPDDKLLFRYHPTINLCRVDRP